jgi:folate-binding protein YgfZ
MAIQAAPELEPQYRALSEGAGLLDQSARGKLDLLGPDAIEFLQGQVTNDLEGLAPGQGCYALLLSPKARVLADMRVLLRSEQELWLDTEPVTLEALRSKLEMYKIGRRLEIADRTDGRAILSLIGPAAPAVVAPAVVPNEENAFVEAEIEGARVVLAATDLGVDLMLEAAKAQPVASALLERGAAAVSEEAAEIRRIERGRPRYGLDVTDENLPAEVGLEQRAVSFTKGCYVGQEPVARMHYRGHPNRHLRGLELSTPAARGDAVVSGEKEVGRVTSTCVSPTFGPIALAVLRREVEPRHQVLVGADRSAATVVEFPFGGS